MGVPLARSAALLLGLVIVATGLQLEAALGAARVALVIGNGAYQRVPTLPNPPNDATDIAASFNRLGFSVRTLTDARFEDMRRGLIEFGREAREADMAVVFFAGHGMEIGGENWLIPIDAELRNDTDAENEAISLRAVMLQVANARGLGLVILDACRNNPFAAKITRSIRTRAVASGLARTEPTDNVLVAYAAKDGTTATDGAGRNSPFTTALLNNLERPGLEVTFMFRNVRDEVMGATKREQQPFVYGSLSKEAIYLKNPPPAAAAPSVSPAAVPPDELLWSTIRESKVPALFEEFLRRFPNSARAPEARTRLAEAQKATGSTPAQARVALQAPAANAGSSGSDTTPAGGLFTTQDAQRVAALASQHQIPLPQFRINRPDAKVSPDVRKFVGVWATKVAFGGGRGRQTMIIITDVDADRRVSGHWAFGPPTAASLDQNPANSFAFSGRIEGDTLRFDNRIATWVVKFTVGDNLHVAQERKDGRTPTANLEAVWRLVERERSAGR
jgi:uncharacterized caspase-like protein